MPALAILMHELSGLVSSWLVRLWLIATAVTTFLIVAGNWTRMESALLIALVLATYLVFPWFFVVIVLGISPLTGPRLDALADGILSRPVTRYEYLLTAWLARVLAVLAVFLVVTLPAMLLIVFARRPPADDGVTFYGMVAALFVVALVLTFLVTLAFCMGTLLRNAWLATVLLVFVWYPVNFVLHTFALEEFSPISLSQALPTLLRTPWSRGTATDARGTDPEDIAEMMRQTNQFLSVLAGTPTPARQPEGSFFQQGNYGDLSVLRVSLGYGLPMLVALGLALWFFNRRDL